MKKLLVICCFLLIFGLSGCAKNTIDDKVIVIGASPSPHAEILEQVRAYLEARGYELKIKPYTDYILPNVALDNGELDANFFQHLPYLKQYNIDNKTDLVSVLGLHYEPLGLYAGKSKQLDTIPNGAKIAVPNDTTNHARALLLLASLGIIEVDESKGVHITKKDITKNEHNVDIISFEAAAIPVQLNDVDYAVINGNYAVSAKVPQDRLLGNESVESLAAQTYTNIIAVKRGNEQKPAILALIDALSQPSIRQFIIDTYDGNVVPFA